MVGRFLDVPQAGEERENMLAGYRNGLRGLVDPATGAAFSEADIARATQEGSPTFHRFNAVDMALLAVHAKAPALADQFVPSRSTTGALRGLHAPLRGVLPLKASGASLTALAPATVGAIFVGSTTLPDPAAAYATHASGKTYQLLYSVTTPANGIAGSDPLSPLVLVSIDTGDATNLPAGTKLKWAGNAPLGAEIEFTTQTDGSGGLPDESDADLADRIESDIAHPPESANNAHFRKWARQASVAVEDAFIYACASYAGTKLVCVTQKRGRQLESAPRGPLARIPSAGTLAFVRSYVVSPASPVSPDRGVDIVCAPVAQAVDLVLGVQVPRGRGLGWADVRPWPLYDAAATIVTTVTNTTTFRVSSAPSLPSGVTAPSLMSWVIAKGRWQKLRVASVTSAGGGLWDVVLTSPPSSAVLVGDYISPQLRGLVQLGQGAEAYFDSLGPGEVVDLTSDTRAPRAQRFPDPVERYPQRAGSTIVATLQARLPGTITTGEVLAISATTPAIPADVATGPSLLVENRLAVYPSD